MMKLNELLRLNLQHFAEDEIDPPTDPTPVDPPDTVDPPVEKTLTQAEFEEALKKRLERERKKYEGYDDFKTKASEYEKLVEEKRLAELSEKERLEEIAKKHEAEKASYAQELETLRESIKAEKIRSAFNQVATGSQIEYLDDAFHLADLSAVTVEEGKVVGMEDAIKTLVDNKPFLISKKQPKSIGEPTNGGNTNEEVKTLEAQLADAKKSKDFNKVIELSNKIAGIFK